MLIPVLILRGYVVDEGQVILLPQAREVLRKQPSNATNRRMNGAKLSPCDRGKTGQNLLRKFWAFLKFSCAGDLFPFALAAHLILAEQLDYFLKNYVRRIVSGGFFCVFLHQLQALPVSEQLGNLVHQPCPGQVLVLYQYSRMSVAEGKRIVILMILVLLVRGSLYCSKKRNFPLRSCIHIINLLQSPSYLLILLNYQGFR